MKLCCFRGMDGLPRPGLLIEGNAVRDLTPAGIRTLTDVLEQPSPLSAAAAAADRAAPEIGRAHV